MKPKLPPGPRPSPWYLYSYIFDPDISLKCARRYGDPFTAASPFGPMVITGDPTTVQELLKLDAEQTEAFPREFTAPLFGEESILVLNGARHQRRRRLMSPTFHIDAMRAHSAVIVEVVTEEISRLRAGQTFMMLESTRWIALEVILRAVFGLSSRARIDEFRGALMAVFENANPLFLFIPRLQVELGGRGPWAKFVAARGRMRDLITEEIRQRRGANRGGKDILSAMLELRYDDGEPLSDVEIRDELFTLVGAGHETTFLALSWAFYEIERNPGVRARLLRELDALGEDPEPEAIASVEYLDALCHEILRLHPVADGISRKVVRSISLNGYEIPAGTAVTVSPTILHNNEQSFPEPLALRPERFLGRRVPQFQFISFGGGFRRCLGAAFAIQEMKLVLGTIYRRCRVRLASSAPLKPVRRSMLFGPEGSVPMIYDGPRVVRAGASGPATPGEGSAAAFGCPYAAGSS